MARTAPLSHLPLPLVLRGSAVLPRGGGGNHPETEQNRGNFAGHAAKLRDSVVLVGKARQQLLERREKDGLPPIAAGTPVLLQVDPGLELDKLRQKFNFEIVSEQEDGFVLVASEDMLFSDLQEMISDFATNAYGSATIASVHRLFDDASQNDRIKRILSQFLFSVWHELRDEQIYTCDFGISVTGTGEIPPLPNRGKRDTEDSWATKLKKWEAERAKAYDTWDQLKLQREGQIAALVEFYEGRILNNLSEAAETSLPDSFTTRIEIRGKGLRDIVLTYPYLFEVTEPDDVAWTLGPCGVATIDGQPVEPIPPAEDAPAVCVVDSGVQEEHPLLSVAVDRGSSRCFLPGTDPAAVADEVPPGGHGTRVAGAILYGETIRDVARPRLRTWIQNARILDNQAKLPTSAFPPVVLRSVVEHFARLRRRTRIFNHSVNASAPFRTRHMSAWAAEIDSISECWDVLIVQSAGNLPESAQPPSVGIVEHLAAGRDYPRYLDEPASRIANPAQSLQAITVGSVAYGAFEGDGWTSFASTSGQPSAFSRVGFGIWDVIKPEVVERGGDNLRTSGQSPSVGIPSVGSSCYPDLVRSTRFPPGPTCDRDIVGTSFAAPKVSRIAAAIQQALPDASCLLYRALIVQSARWPDWAQDASNTDGLQILRRIGFGIPSEERATANTEHRVTLVGDKDPMSEAGLRIGPRQCHLFQVPIPAAMRRPGTDYKVLIEVTLSYAARPRRTRRHLRSYLSTWLTWSSSKLGEPIERFKVRALKGQPEDPSLESGKPLKWMLHEKPGWGVIKGVKRNAGTVQKDWAIVDSNMLPEDFCIAVVGHKGWSADPDSTARYAIAVTFELLNREIPIYEEVRLAVDLLQATISEVVEVESDTE